MIRRHVLAALGEGVQAADDEVARMALANIDWVLRGQARRRLESAILDATIAVGSEETVEGARARLRAAALIACGKQVDLGDREAIAAAYNQLAVAPPPRLPIATGVVAAASVVLVMFMAFAMVRVVTADPSNGEFTRPSPPAGGGAFRDGGTPLRDAAIEQVLVTDVPALEAVKVTDDADRKQRIAVLRLHPAFSTHSTALANAWRDMIDTYDRWRDVAGSTSREAFKISRELVGRVAVVSDQLAAAGLGYFLDVEIGEDSRRRPGIYSFRVDDVGFVRANDERVRVLGLRRMSRSDLAHDQSVARPSGRGTETPYNDQSVARPSGRGTETPYNNVTVLGMTTSEPRDPVVLLDEVDEKVRTQIIPILGGQPYVVGDDSWARTARGRKVALAASEAIRRELHTALGFDAESLDRATARCKKIVAASIRHHEAQHGFDRTRKLPYPAELAQHAGPASSEFAIRTRYELSGYLSQLASDTWLPQLTLWNLSRHAFRRNMTGPVEEAYVAVFIIEGLARHLRIQSPGAVMHRGIIDRDRLAELVLPLGERSTVEIRSAAAALWNEAFDARLVRIVDDE